VITGTSDWIERHVFPADDNRCQQICKSHDHLSCGRNQSQEKATSNCTELLSFELGAVTTSHERKLNSTCTTKNPTRTSTDCCKCLDLETQLKETLRELSSVKLISEILNKENQALKQTSHNDASTNSTWINARSRGPRGTAFDQPPKIAPTTHDIPVASQYKLPIANRYDALSSRHKLWEHSDPISTTRFEQTTKPMPGHTNEHTKVLRKKKSTSSEST